MGKWLGGRAQEGRCPKPICKNPGPWAAGLLPLGTARERYGPVGVSVCSWGASGSYGIGGHCGEVAGGSCTRGEVPKTDLQKSWPLGCWELLPVGVSDSCSTCTAILT